MNRSQYSQARNPPEHPNQDHQDLAQSNFQKSEKRS